MSHWYRTPKKAGLPTSVRHSGGVTRNDQNLNCKLNQRRLERMFEVTVEAAFSAGHYLRNYHGKCENPHGHNYRVLVTLAGESVDDSGLLLDFKQLKEILRPTVEYLDHQMINDLEPFQTLNPSAENLARFFFERTHEQVSVLSSSRVHVSACTVYETDTSAATYRQGRQSFEDEMKNPLPAANPASIDNT
jgi:6-pyruvoyltetrahydropterin/6-carboxytetrahydropterin synthase